MKDMDDRVAKNKDEVGGAEQYASLGRKNDETTARTGRQ
jgi:hypothetical protein